MSRTAASNEDSSKKDLLSQYLKKYNKVKTNCLIYTPGEKQMEDLRTIISNLYNVKDNFVTVPLKGTEKDYDKIPVSSGTSKSNKTKRTVSGDKEANASKTSKRSLKEQNEDQEK